VKACDITVEQVREAYRKTGLTPCAAKLDASHGTCCAIGALLVEAGQPPPSAWGGLPSYFSIEEVLKLDLVHSGVTSFELGFDDGFSDFSHASSFTENSEDHVRLSYARGYEVGTAIRREGIK
jgi:hypothetical protein